MARFYGNVGFADQQIEDPVGSGIWKNVPVEYAYYGDVLRAALNYEVGETRNSDISLGHRISIFGDEFANDNFFSIRYVEYAGVLWTVTNVTVERPRIILSIGEVYNGEQA